MSFTHYWDAAYRQADLLWGERPDEALLDYAILVPPGEVLDLGLGEGRQSAYFARRGHPVVGYDLSPVAIERCRQQARDANLNVRAEVGDIRTLAIEPGRYSLIIAAWVLQFLRPGESEAVVAQALRGLKPGGLFYLSVFSTDDPSAQRARAGLEPVEKNTFILPKDNLLMHFFTLEEVARLCASLRPIYFVSGVRLDTTHGEPHSHGFIAYLGQKT